MELYAVAFSLLTCGLGAMWLLARRVRAWKEQILHSVAVVESNNAIAHEATRREMAVQLGMVRSEIDELFKQTDLRRMVEATLGPPRLIADRRPPSVRFDAAVAFLRSINLEGVNPEAERAYLELHVRRLARTLDITPTPGSTRRALELGAYMQITPALACLLGYDEVRGAYLGSPEQGPYRKTVSIDGQQIFACDIDLFDAERDAFPYPDGHFDVVLACEILEHLQLDPMHMFLEARRVLAPYGALVLTTPNTASFTSIARAIGGVSPQIYSRYPIPGTELPHVREYTPAEIHDVLMDAGFTIESIFTEPIDTGSAESWVRPMLEHLRFPTNLRGEQIYLVARKRADANIVRRPDFLYEQP